MGAKSYGSCVIRAWLHAKCWSYLAPSLLLLLALPGSALAAASTFTFPVNRVDTNPCTGETVVVSGTLHVNVATNVSMSGNFLIHESDKESVSGTAPATGAKYLGETSTSFDYT